MTTLYKISPSGQTLQWQITAIVEGTVGTLRIVWGAINGLKQQQIIHVACNMSGRNIVEQTNLEMHSRINKQLDKGYRHSLDEAALHKGLNAANLYRPMLAQKYANVAQSIDAKKYKIQYKYDGHRCLITRVDDELIAYSRNGKPITTIDHILQDIDIPEGAVLDGELYIHGQPLQKISSIVRRKQSDNKELKYVLFDQICDLPFEARFDGLHKYKYNSANVIIAPTADCETSVLTGDMIRELAMSKGYEGFILRHNKLGYEPGKRSYQVLKAKVPDSNEFEIVDITPSKDGWGILTCKFDNGTFNVSAPGTFDSKKDFLVNKEKFIGRKITVEYFNTTIDGTPFHPVAIANLRDSELE